MFDSLKQMLGMGPKVDLGEVVARGATILDVRTPAEYAGGHINGSVNIPLNDLGRRLAQLKKEKPVITCCASGMRSASAKSLLSSAGFSEVYNGGPWQNLKKFEK